MDGSGCGNSPAAFGCGGSAETEPPESEAVTTDPLEIELPDDSVGDAAEAPAEEGEEAESDEGDTAEAPDEGGAAETPDDGGGAEAP